jgi:hypothetical protein
MGRDEMPSDEVDLIDRLLAQYPQPAPFDVTASDLAVRAEAIDREPEGEAFDYASLAAALDEPRDCGTA